MTDTITLDFSKVFYNSNGDATKDMLDPPIGRTFENAPDLTYGSFVANSLMTGIRVPAKEALQYYQIAHRIELALKNSEGKLEYTVSDVSKLEQALQKVNDAQFLQVFFMGAIQQFLLDAKNEFKSTQKT